MRRQRLHRQQLVQLCIALALAAVLAGCSPGARQPTAAPQPSALAPVVASALPQFKHIFIIVMENKEYTQVIGNPKAPYLNRLASQYGLATNYYGIRHPSLPNYLALTGGSTFGITSDCVDCVVDQPNIVDQLEGSGRSWKAYIESMPQPCFLGNDGQLYRQKHNPFIYYKNVRSNPARCGKIVPFEELATDLSSNSLPEYVWISPNMCSDGHDCTTQQGDDWLGEWVPKILASPAWKDDGVLFITYDEGDSHLQPSESCCKEGHGGHVATLVISPLSKPGYQSKVPYDHYSLLRTVEEAWDLPTLGGASCDCAPPMSDFFESRPVAADGK